MDDCCDYSGAISNVGVADRTPSFASDNIIWIAAVVQVLRTSQYDNLKRVALLPVSGTVLQLGLKSQRISIGNFNMSSDPIRAKLTRG